MYFRSKKSIGLGIFIWSIMIFAFIEIVYIGYRTNSWFTPALFLLPLFLTLWIWLGTGYVLNGNVLVVRCGPIKKKIDIRTINEIRETSNPSSSPALSLERLEITYGNGHMVLVSPKEKKRFLDELERQQSASNEKESQQ